MFALLAKTSYINIAMKVLFVVNNFYAKGNGLSGSARRTVRKLKEAGLDVKILSGPNPDPQGPEPEFLLQDYPKDHYHLVVISDHMQPETNELLRKHPITVLTPTFEKSSKAKAMQYAINEVKGDFDNVVILDADNVVRPEFLSQLNVLCSVC